MTAVEDTLFAEFQKTGEPAALGRVYDRVAPELLSLALHLADGPAEAEDLVQGTFVTAIERARSWDASQRVLPWLVGILGRRAKSARRAAGRVLPERPSGEPPDDPPDDPAERAVAAELGERLHEAVHRLPEACRSVLILRLEHGLAPAEIAHALGRPPGTVRSQMARGLEHLRQALPAGLAGAALGVLSTPGRGLGAVREAVVAHAAQVHVASGAGLGAASYMGVLAMKKLLVVAALAAVVGSGWWLLPEAAPPAVPAGASAAPAALVELAAPARDVPRGGRAEERRAAPVPAAPAPAAPPEPEPAAAGSTGELVVRASWEGTGEPAADVVAIVRRFARELPYLDELPMRTDAGGELRVQVPAGYTHVRLLRGGEAGVHVPAGGRAQLELQLFEGVNVVGTVVDGAGRPVPHAELWVSLRWQPIRGHVAARADADGRFRLRGISRWHWIGARAAGFAPSYVQKVPGEPGDEVAVQIALDGGARRVRGRVVDRSGAPIPGAWVLIGSEDPNWSARLSDGLHTPGAPPLRLRADAAGRFESDHVVGELFELRARAPGFAPSREEHELREGRELVVTLGPEAVVRGRVSDGRGNPLRALVCTPRRERFGFLSVQAAEEGFRLSGLPAGEVELEAFHPEHGRARATFVLREGEEREWNPVLEPVLEVSGRVLAASGEPLAGWNVSAFRTGTQGERSHTEKTDREGVFRLSDLPDESHTLWVIAPGAFGGFPRLIREGVRPGGVPLVLQLDDEGLTTGRVEGLVLAPDGAPTGGVRVTVWHHELRLWREFTADADTGAIEIQDVPPGTIELQLRPRDHPWVYLGDHTLRAGGVVELGTLVLEHAGHLAGAIRGGSDERLDSLVFVLVDGSGREHGVVVRAGREFRSGPIGAGDYTLAVHGDFVRSQHLSFALRPGAERRLDVDLEPAGMRRVGLERPAHEPEVRWASARATDAGGALVWQQSGIARRAGQLELRLSAAPGTYDLSVETSSGLTARARVTIEGLGESAPLSIALYRPSGATASEAE